MSYRRGGTECGIMASDGSKIPDTQVYEELHDPIPLLTFQVAELQVTAMS